MVAGDQGGEHQAGVNDHPREARGRKRIIRSAPTTSMRCAPAPCRTSVQVEFALLSMLATRHAIRSVFTPFFLLTDLSNRSGEVVEAPLGERLLTLEPGRPTALNVWWFQGGAASNPPPHHVHWGHKALEYRLFYSAKLGA
jgi:hypothetical protein